MLCFVFQLDFFFLLFFSVEENVVSAAQGTETQRTVLTIVRSFVAVE